MSLPQLQQQLIMWFNYAKFYDNLLEVPGYFVRRKRTVLDIRVDPQNDILAEKPGFVPPPA